LGVSVCPQPRESFGDTDAELFGEHTGGLGDLGVVGRQSRGLAGREGAKQGIICLPGLGIEQQHGGDVGEDQRAAELEGVAITHAPLTSTLVAAAAHTSATDVRPRRLAAWAETSFQTRATRLASSPPASRAARGGIT
jgi:hypothetical protein